MRTSVQRVCRPARLANCNAAAAANVAHYVPRPIPLLPIPDIRREAQRSRFRVNGATQQQIVLYGFDQ